MDASKEDEVIQEEELVLLEKVPRYLVLTEKGKDPNAPELLWPFPEV